MKKQLLLSLSLSICIGAVAQTSYTRSGTAIQKADPKVANKGAEYKGPISDGPKPTFQSTVNNLKHPAPTNTGSRTFTATVIGTSIYDLQTNASICNRIILNSDGTICATWTMAHGTDPANGTPDRGTGYNYFDGSAWTSPAGTSNLRLENLRVGWPNIGVTSTGGEVVFTHEATTASVNNIHMMSRAAKGTGAWTETSMSSVPDTWPRMVVGGSNGMTIHLISQTSGAAPVKPPFKGQDGALCYSRSLDGGATWDKLHTVIPQIDSTSYLGFGGDDYAIDARGDVIVIVAGGNKNDVVMIKSTDNGNSWTKTIIKKFPIPKFNGATMITDTIPTDGIADTIESNDGAIAVLIDNSNKAHVWYGRMRVTCNNPGTASGQGLLYFPITDGLMYWDENMGSAAPVMISSVQDINNDGILNVSAIGTYYTSMSGMPSAGIDASGRLFVAYSGVYEGISDDGTVAGGKSYRHMYVMRSDDNGQTWCTPQDVTDPGPNPQDYIEGVFGAIARNVDANVHMIYQRDGSVGNGLTGSPAGSTDPQSGTESDIVYVKLPIADVACGVGVGENKETVSKVNIFPNPATTTATISFTVARPAKAEIAIYNALGQNIANFSNQFSVAGTHQLNINTANYKPGIYFVNSTVEGKRFSQKLVIE